MLRSLAEQFSRERPLAGLRVAGCLQITAETANLARMLTIGGFDLVLCTSNPLSTTDAAAAALVEHLGSPQVARCGVFCPECGNAYEGRFGGR